MRPPLIMPNYNNFSKCDPHPWDAIAVQTMGFTGITRSYDFGNSLHRYTLALSTQDAADFLAGRWQSFFRQLRTRHRTLLFSDPMRRTPLGIATGTPRINGAAQSGAITKTNLALKSQALDHATWTKTRGSIVADAAAADDGNWSLDQFIEDGTSGFHGVTQSITKPATALVYTYQAKIKQSGARTVARITMSTGAGANGVGADIDLVAGTIGNPFTFGSGWTALFSSVLAYNNGVFRISITGLSNTATDLQITIGPISGGSSSYAGDSASGFFGGDADIKQSESLSEYIATDAVAESAVYPGIVVDGYTPQVANQIREGDHFQLDGNLYIATADSNSAPSTGDSTILMWPPLRRAPPDNSPLTLRNAMGIFRLEDSADFSTNQEFWLTGEPFNIVEVPQL